jgi:uncharacterized membrane protein YhiD involved in acid resistance
MAIGLWLIVDELILRLGLALAIGILVGLERVWRERDAPGGSRTVGILTFGIAGLLGGLSAALAQTIDAPSLYFVGGSSLSLTKARPYVHG